jgi:TRAP-type C4-dicarboxylate transport system permease small subunit
MQHKHIFNSTIASLTAIKATGLPRTMATPEEIRVVLGIVFGVLGALALLFITISGLRYVLSNGDAQKVARAKDGIIYSLVGLVVALSAESIVVFVIGRT